MENNKGNRMQKSLLRRGVGIVIAGIALLMAGALSVSAAVYTFEVDPQAGGEVTIFNASDGTTSYIGGSNYPVSKSMFVTNGQQFVVTASEIDPYLFLDWTVDNGSITDTNSPNAQTFTVNGGGSLRANFALPQRQLVMLSDGHASEIKVDNVVVTTPYTNSFDLNSHINIEAKPVSADYEFWVWGQDSSAVKHPMVPTNYNSAVSTVILSDDATVRAYFNRIFALTQDEPNGPGSSVISVNYPSNYVTYVEASRQTANVTPLQRDICTGWTGGYGGITPATGNSPTYGSLQMVQDSGLDWTWTRQYRLFITQTGEGDVSPTAGSNIWYNAGDSAYLNASAAAGYVFNGWFDHGTRIGFANYALVMNAAHDITAQFIQVGSDSDQDGLPDAWEVKYGLKVDPNAGPDNGASGDPDNDGLNNLAEMVLQNTNGTLPFLFSDPINADTDGDGMDDGYERHFVDPELLPVDSAGGLLTAVLDNRDSTDRGAGGNMDGDVKWSTVDGYRNPFNPLTNIEEWRGPDGEAPLSYETVAVGAVSSDGGWTNTLAKPVRRAIKRAEDTGDQSASNSSDTDKDGFEDGYEFMWDKWQQTNSAMQEVFVYSYWGDAVTNIVPVWDGITNVTRRYNPATRHAAVGESMGDPDFDVLYDYGSGGASAHWYTDFMEYSASSNDAFSAAYPNAPHSIVRNEHPSWERSSHPFLIDVDKDGLPDGYEVIFGLDPWAAVSPGSNKKDSERNPDGDYMAYSSSSNLHNKAVYDAYGFDPRTGWGAKYPDWWQVTAYPGQGLPTTNTKAFANLDEMYGADGKMRLTPTSTSGSDDTTSPILEDTDSDGMWDGWELYVGLNPLKPGDASKGGTDDHLSNLAEFQSFVTGDQADGINPGNPLPNWMNKIFPTDPNDPDTDGDGILDGTEESLFNNPTGTYTFTFPDSATADGLTVTNIAGGTYQLYKPPEDLAGEYVGGGLNPTSADTDHDGMPDPFEACYHNVLNGALLDSWDDPDGDKLLNYQEYLTASTYHWQYDAWAADQPAYDPADFFVKPKHWDWYQTCNNRPFSYIPFLGAVWDAPAGTEYSSTRPDMVDSDGDGMDDFWEIYHGLNPIYGFWDLVAERDGGVPTTVLDSGMPLSADPRALPFVNGTTIMDSDADGIANIEESVGLSLEGSPAHHTDPTPYWITDRSYANSWVNLYYKPGPYWFMPSNGVLPPPTYVFSFESNEGYDTDNDNQSDAYEIRGGGSSPVDDESPIKRGALYLPHSGGYARTRTGYFYQDLADTNSVVQLRQFTVEAWVRPEQPKLGRDQIVVERPFYMDIGNPMDLTPGIRVNFRLGINGEGQPFAGYNGTGKQLIFVEALAGSDWVINSNQWTHLAATYQFQTADTHGRLKLYINGEIAATEISDEIPTAGFWGVNNIFYTTAPVIIGASDLNPLGTIPEGFWGSPEPENFFRGWIDEVRIWNGARSQAQINATMFDALSRVQGAGNYTNRASGAVLMSRYGFDDTPDPQHGGIVPAGFEATMSAIQPSDWSSIAWLSGAPDRSQVYRDYQYVVWLSDTMAHLPVCPPVDVGDTNTVDTNGVCKFPNPADPYTEGYFTALDANDESSLSDSDLLPLKWAEADADIPMWDDGTIPAHDTHDTDGDGMPDWWEEKYGLNPVKASGYNGADGDPDGDGLSNYYEYLLGSDPQDADTDKNGISDYDEDPDGDTLSTRSEIEDYHSNPANADTDDDGIDDGVEVENSTDPKSSLSPYIARAIEFKGGTGSVVTVAYDKLMPDKDRFDLTTWTVEMIVQPASDDQTAVLLQKKVDSTGVRNFEVGLTNGHPYVVYDTGVSSPVIRAVSPFAITNGASARTHIAARCIAPKDGASGRLELFVNGDIVAGDYTRSVCAVGAGDLVIGSPEYKGTMREIRLWKTARKDDDIRNYKDKTLFFGAGVADSGYLHVSGDGLLKESASTKVGIDYIDQLSDGWTLEAWIRTTDTDGGMIIARRNQSQSTDNDFNYYLGLSPDGTLIGKFAIEYVTSGGTNTIVDFTLNDINGEITVNDGKWHHVAYVRDSSSCRLYVDGVRDGLQGRFLIPIGINIISSNVRANSGPVVVGELLDGDIDECRIWNYGLDQEKLRDVASHNLAGNEEGLISYLSFDYQQTAFADERANARDPENEYGIYIRDAERIVDNNDGAPITISPMKIYNSVALIGYFAAVDGGDTVEDYSHQMGESPFNNERYAGVFGSTNASFHTIAGDNDDSDGDGIPDWWETQHGLNPGVSTMDEGAYGDPDHDGLINLYEYLAYVDYGVDMDPLAYRTFDTDAVNDYLYVPAGGSGLTLGELYDDTDVLPDGWESKYPMIMDRHTYNRDQDPDHDNWNNQEEYLGGTDPSDPASHPSPVISGTIQYVGSLASASNAFSVLAYDSADMDTVPVEGVVTDVNGVHSFMFTNISSRTVWLLAYKPDTAGGNGGGGNGGGTTTTGFTAGDAYGIAGPISVSFDGTGNVIIPVMDQADMGWYPAFSWPAQTKISSVYVQIKNNSGYIILRRYIHTDRNTFHEVDYQRGAATLVDSYMFGLNPGSYSWTAASNNMPDVKYRIAEGMFNVPDYTPTTPEIVSPSGVDKIVHQLHDFVWKSDPQSPMPRYQIEITPVAGGWTYTTNVSVQASDLDGTHVIRMPLEASENDLFGNGRWVNGEYNWRVRGGNNSVYGSWSATRRFELAVTNAPSEASGAPQISGDIIYHGKAPADNIVVRAYKSPGYGGRVEGQLTLSGTAPFDMNYTMSGLRHVTYTLMAFLDLNTNGVCDEWEPQGLARDSSYGSHYQYRADAYGLGSFDLTGATHVYNASILIRDRDTDNDNIMDGWEWQNMHHSPRGMTYSGDDDLDGDGLSNLKEYGLNSNPIESDSDGDGISDGDEVNIYGSSPTSVDSDGDSIPDGVEVGTPGLNPTNADDDGDGVPTLLEVSWGSAAGSIDSGDLNPESSDTDGDGVPDLMEIASGSDPINAASASLIAINSIDRKRGSISWDVGSNIKSVDVTYVIEYSPDMVTWTAVGEVTDDGDSHKTLTKTGINLPAKGGFYRLKLEIR